ncbi:MAG: hypothetical protein ACLQFR_10730 [Streptosporangiaceae bacterium]
MSSSPPADRWRFLVSPRWLAWHAFTVIAAGGMLWLGDWQLRRAEGGNTLSWAYTFEWPIFTIFVVVFWAKTIMDEWRHPGGAAAKRGFAADGQDDAAGSVGLPDAAHNPADSDAGAADDPELAAYNAYLASLNRPKRPARSRPARADD